MPTRPPRRSPPPRPPRQRDQSHYDAEYRRRRAVLIAEANADPDTRCWRCGHPLDYWAPDDCWTTGHVRDTDPTSPLLAEHASCNYRAGGALGAQRREANRRHREGE